MRPTRHVRLIIGICALAALCPSAASAAPPFQDLGAAAGPLNHINVANELGCQVQHTGDTTFEFYPPAAEVADCGTFLWDGTTLYSPDFAAHNGTATGSLGTFTGFTPVSQTAVTGSGSAGDPRKVVTVVDAGATGLRVTETDTYEVGSESYRTDVTINNTTGAAKDVVLYRAGDCYLQNSDSGFGFTGSGGVGCSATANNSPPDRIEQWIPLVGTANFTEDGYSTVWSQIGAHTAFPNACAQCTNDVDNGAGLSYSLTIPANGAQTIAHNTTFSPTGGVPPATSGGPASTPAGTSPASTPAAAVVPPPAPPAVPAAVPTIGPAGNPLGLPTLSCIDKRKFSFRLRRPAGRVVDVTVSVNGKQTMHKTGTNITRLTIAKLPNRGSFKVRIDAISADGTKLVSQRTYKTCKKSRPKGKKIKPKKSRR